MTRAVLALAALLAACGDAAIEPVRLDGEVVLGGPVAGATVTVTAMRDDGSAGAARVATTGPDGAFALDVPGDVGAFAITATGGSEVDLATGATVARPDAALAAMILEPGLARPVMVSPFSTLAYTFATRRLALGLDPEFRAAHANAIADISTHFLGIADVTRGHVAGVLAAPQAALTDDVTYALAIGALSRLAHDAAVDSGATIDELGANTILVAWLADLGADARFDGHGPDGAAVTIGACATRPALCRIDEAHVRAGFATAASELLADPVNQTGLGWSRVARAIEATSEDANPRLFPPGTPPAFDVDGPAVIWNAPADGATVTGPFTIDVSARDLTAVMSLSVVLHRAPPEADLSLPADQSNAYDHYVVSVDAASLPTGPQVLRAISTDVFGNATISDRTVALN